MRPPGSTRSFSPAASLSPASRRCRRQIKIPLITGGGSGPLADLDWMAAHGVRVALQGHAPFSAAVQAVYNTLKALRDGTKPGDLQGIASPELMQRVTRAADYRQWTKDFLGGE